MFSDPTKNEWILHGRPGNFSDWRDAEWKRRSTVANIDKRIGWSLIHGLAIGTAATFLWTRRRSR